MSKAKKILGMAISAMVLAATMSMGAMAEPSTVNLMPADASAITCGNGGTVEMKGSSVVFKAGSADTSFTYPVTMKVDMTVTDYFYFDIDAGGGWDIKWTSSALNQDVNPGVSSDFGNIFGKDGNPGENQYGTLIEAGTYAPGDVEIGAAGAYTWNDNLPDDGMITMKSIEVKVGANSELTLNALYFGDMDAAEAAPNGAVSADTTTEAPTTTTTTEAATTASTTTTAAETTTTTTTTAAAEDGGNTGLIVGIVVAVVVVAAVAVGVVVYMKKKKKD